MILGRTPVSRRSDRGSDNSVKGALGAKSTVSGLQDSGLRVQSDQLHRANRLLVRSYRKRFSQFLTDFALTHAEFIPARVRAIANEFPALLN